MLPEFYRKLIEKKMEESGVSYADVVEISISPEVYPDWAVEAHSLLLKDGRKLKFWENDVAP